MSKLEKEALLQPGDPPGMLNAKPAVRKYSFTTISLVILCVFLTVGLVVVTLKYATSNTRESNKSKRDTLSLKHFIQVSDTHLDIYYDSNVTNQNKQLCRNRNITGSSEIMKSDTTAIFGRIKCDAPLHLVESVKTHIQKVSKELENDVEFILITGDQAAHSYEYFDVNVLDSVIWSIANSTKAISDAIPGIPVFVAIGNNDLKYDYLPPVNNHSKFYQSLYDILVPYVFPKGSDIALLNSKDEFKKSFGEGGYYSIVFNGGKMLLVILNSDYWSIKAYNINRTVTVIGDSQMKWLHGQLDAAKSNKQKVIIAGHIPPGIDSYHGKSSWISNYTSVYTLMTTQKFRDIIIVQLYGHIHQDKIKLQYLGDKYFDDEDKAFILTCPSVSPIYGVNPSFRVYDYNNKERSLQDYTQYYLDMAASNVNKEAYWFKEYSFRETYEVGLTMKGVEQIIDQLLQPSTSAWFYYSQYIKAKMGGVHSYQRYTEYCAAKYLTEPSYMKCINKYKDVGV